MRCCLWTPDRLRGGAHLPWDCLGAIGVCRSAGVRVNDYVSENSLLHGGPIVAGSPEAFDQLVAVLGDTA